MKRESWAGEPEDLLTLGYQAAEMAADVLLQRGVDEQGDKSHQEKRLSMAEIL